MNGMFGFVENITISADMTEPPKGHLLLQRHTVTVSPALSESLRFTQSRTHCYSMFLQQQVHLISLFGTSVYKFQISMLDGRPPGYQDVQVSMI